MRCEYRLVALVHCFFLPLEVQIDERERRMILSRLAKTVERPSAEGMSDVQRSMSGTESKGLDA